MDKSKVDEFIAKVHKVDKCIVKYKKWTSPQSGWVHYQVQKVEEVISHVDEFIKARR